MRALRLYICTHVGLFDHLEALFNVGQTDLRYRVARAMAVLLGQWMHSSETLFEVTKQAYDLRSRLVHTGKADLKGFHVDTLRRYVHWAILKMIEVDLPKETVAEILTRLAFGQADSITHRSTKVLRERDWWAKFRRLGS
jgi:hypothetical protein